MIDLEEQKTDEDLAAWLMGWVIALAAIAALVVPVRNWFGGFSSCHIQGRFIINECTQLGSEVRALTDVLVWEEAGGVGLLGTQLEGALGILVGGSIQAGEDRWWDIDFNVSPDGWVLESDIELVSRVAALAGYLKLLSYLLSFLFLYFISYSIFRINKIRKTEREMLKVPNDSAFGEGGRKNERWEHVLGLVESTNPNDWRAAVIEADIILDELVLRMGYSGENLGERLKGVEKSDFTTLDNAWEAHKVRNRIAHEGGDFILTQREAKRVVALFGDVFEEFHII